MASPRTRRRAVRWLIERIWVKGDDDATPAGRRKAPRRMASFPSRAPRGRSEALDLPDRHVPEAPPLARLSSFALHRIVWQMRTLAARCPRVRSMVSV